MQQRGQFVTTTPAEAQNATNNATPSRIGGGWLHLGLREPKPWEAYLFTVVVTALTLGFRLAFDEALEGRPTLVVFTMPIMLSAYVGGLRAGLLATALSYFAASYYLLPPIYSFVVTSTAERWQQFFVVLAGVFISVLNEALHRARRQAALSALEHLQARKALDKAEVLQAAIFNSADFSIIATDKEGLIQIFNIGAERILGYSAADVVNKITPAALHEPQEVLDRAAALSLEHGAEIAPGFAALAFKAALGLEDIYEVTKVRKDGTRFPTRLSVTALRDAEGRIIGYLFIASDNTARKQADMELQKANAKLKAWTQALNSFAIVEETNTQGRITYVNDPFCQISKYTRAELLGRDHRDVVSSGAHPKEFWKEMWGTISQGKIWRGEIKNRAKDGTVYWVDTVIVPLLGADGRPETYLAIRFVTTERKTAEEERARAENEVQSLNAALEERVLERTMQLKSANEELESFSYSVSHDLRAPLRHIAGFVELLQRDSASVLSEKSRRHLATISQAAHRMGELIDDLLTFSRIGKSELLKTDVILDELVRVAIGDVETETAGRNITWDIQPLPVLWADRALLRQVLVNLVSNAVKFTNGRACAKIEIGSAAAGPRESVVFIRDNGAGFDPQYAGKLFGVFQRLHSREEFEGTGIGLANVQRIIRRHGGRVWAAGVLDGGATFHFSIPNKPRMTE